MRGNSITESPSKSVARATSRALLAGGGGGGGGYVPSDSLLHRFEIDALLDRTLVDSVGTIGTCADSNSRAVLSAAGVGHPTLQSLDLNQGADSTSNCPWYKASDISGTFVQTGELARVYAFRPLDSFKAGRLMSRTYSTQFSIFNRDNSDDSDPLYQMVVQSGAQYKRFDVGPLVDWLKWQTWVFYAESNTGIGTGEIVIRAWRNGIEMEYSTSVTTGASAVLSGGQQPYETLLGFKATKSWQWNGDFSIFDASAPTCIADMLAEEQVMRDKWVT